MVVCTSRLTKAYAGLRLGPEKHRMFPTCTLVEHIACSSSTNSEVVVPVKNFTGAVVAVLDVDSNTPAAFSPEDVSFLEQICTYLGEKFHS